MVGAADLARLVARRFRRANRRRVERYERYERAVDNLRPGGGLSDPRPPPAETRASETPATEPRTADASHGRDPRPATSAPAAPAPAPRASRC